MQTTGQTPARRAVEIDEVLLHRATWAIGAVVAVAVAFALDGRILAALAGAVAGALAAKSYMENEVQRDFWVPIETAWTATIRSLALHGLNYDVRRTRRGVSEGDVTAGDSRVRVESHAGGITRVRVRVGWFALPDNRRREALIVEQISRIIETPQAQAV